MTTSRMTSTQLVLGALAVPAIVLTVALFSVGPAGAGASTDGCSGSYSWPIEPVDKPHPIRGAFGDPRTIFDGPPTRATLLEGTGKFSFHQGVDISAPDGEAVLAVATGTVTRVTREWVGVDCGNGRSFEYWHVNARVRAGQRVVARETVIGFVQRSAEHVHLTHVENGRVVSPVAPGRLSPYRDKTRPRVLGISLRRSDGAPDEMANFVRGRVQVLVEAVDAPALRVPGTWSDFPVTPARVTWWIEKWTGRRISPVRVSRDVRESLPAGNRFWETFARGTHQNMAVFGQHYSYLQSGRYLFRLAPHGYDTRQLRDGVYALAVRVEDSAGNHDVQRLRFTVHNRDGWR